LSDDRAQLIVALVVPTLVAEGVPGAVGGVVSALVLLPYLIRVVSVPVAAGALTYVVAPS